MSPKRATPELEAHWKARVRAEQVGPLVAYLSSDLSADITGQVIGMRGDELYLFNQPRPIRTMHHHGGWTLQRIAEQVGPAWRASLTPLEDTYQVFPWLPI